MSNYHHHENDDQHNSRRLYNPYQDLNLRYQTGLYNLPTSPEYLFTEESIAQRRSCGENLTFYTGSGVLSGSVLGAGEGLIKGVKSFEIGDTKKLKVNRILNSGGEIGRSYGTRAGVIGLLFAGFETAMVWYRDKDDALNNVVAGLGTGALYKIGSGPKAMTYAGAIGGVVAGFYVTGKHVFKRYVTI